MLVHVMGPNLHGSERPYHVHAAGCADVQRSAVYRGREHQSDKDTPIEVDNLVEVAEYVYADVEDDPWNLIDDFEVFGCAKGLPRRPCEGHPAGPNDPMGETVYCDGSCA